MASKTYNGHRNWKFWNVSLWIANDEGLYNTARTCKAVGKTSARAAELFIEAMTEAGRSKTPDGAPYSKSAVRAAIAGLE